METIKTKRYRITKEKTACTECRRRMYAQAEERLMDDGSVVTVVLCPKCEAEWPSSRVTPAGVELMKQIEAQRERVGNAFRTPAYSGEKAKLDALLAALKPEVQKL